MQGEKSEFSVCEEMGTFKAKYYKEWGLGRVTRLCAALTSLFKRIANTQNEALRPPPPTPHPPSLYSVSVYIVPGKINYEQRKATKNPSL